MNDQSIAELLFELTNAGYDISFRKFPGSSYNWMVIYAQDYKLCYSVSHILDKSELTNQKLSQDWILKEELLHIQRKIEEYKKENGI